MEVAAKTAAGVTARPARRGASKRKSRLPMVMKLAYRNLFHDRLSLIVTIIGIVFSVVLVAVQCGIYLGSEKRIASVIDNSPADLWVVPIGTKSFDDPSLLIGRERHAVLSTPGVESTEDMLVSFGRWKKPGGGTTAILMVGSHADSPDALPWNIAEGSRDDLSVPNSVAIDKSYFKDLGIENVGDVAEINGTTVKIAAATKSIRSFTTLPYVFTTVPTARQLIGAGPEQSTYHRVKLVPGVELQKVKDDLSARLPEAEILTHDEFRTRSLNYWLFQTGAGAALIAGAVLGIIVGVVIVAQTLYSSTKDHINEFATLRALGAGASYIHKVILGQAILSALIGFLLGFLLSITVIWASQNTKLLIVMTPKLALSLFALTVGMCIFAALSAILKVTRIDPAVVFSR